MKQEQVDVVCDVIDTILFEAGFTTQVAGGLTTEQGVILSLTEPITLPQKLLLLIKSQLKVENVLTAVGLLILSKPQLVPTVDVMTLIREHENQTTE